HPLAVPEKLRDAGKLEDAPDDCRPGLERAERRYGGARASLGDPMPGEGEHGGDQPRTFRTHPREELWMAEPRGWAILRVLKAGILPAPVGATGHIIREPDVVARGVPCRTLWEPDEAGLSEKAILPYRRGERAGQMRRPERRDHVVDQNEAAPGHEHAGDQLPPLLGLVGRGERSGLSARDELPDRHDQGGGPPTLLGP